MHFTHRRAPSDKETVYWRFSGIGFRRVVQAQYGVQPGRDHDQEDPYHRADPEPPEQQTPLKHSPSHGGAPKCRAGRHHVVAEPRTSRTASGDMRPADAACSAAAPVSGTAIISTPRPRTSSAMALTWASRAALVTSRM